MLGRRRRGNVSGVVARSRLRIGGKDVVMIYVKNVILGRCKLEYDTFLKGQEL